MASFEYVHKLLSVNFVILLHNVIRWYRNGAGNNTEENSSVFSLIQIRQLLSARACGQ